MRAMMLNVKVELIIKGIGIITVISTSKMRKITAIKKNCKEKGVREKYKGLNPHSKEEIFSRSLKDLLAIKELRKIIREEINKAMKDNIKITFFFRSLKLEALHTFYILKMYFREIKLYPPSVYRNVKK